VAGSGWVRTPISERRVMGLVVLLLVLALLFGGVGLFVEGLKWALIIALALLVVGALTGYRGRARV
jgi:CHASE2 domain-containing sensor protein